MTAEEAHARTIWLLQWVGIPVLVMCALVVLYAVTYKWVDYKLPLHIAKVKVSLVMLRARREMRLVLQGR